MVLVILLVPLVLPVLPVAPVHLVHLDRLQVFVVELKMVKKRRSHSAAHVSQVYMKSANAEKLKILVKMSKDSTQKTTQEKKM